MILAALAAHRAARAIALDEVSRPLRDKLEIWSIDHRATDAQVKRREWLVKLVSCPHCIGFWLSWVALAYELATRRRPGLRFLLVGWAVAGVQSTLASVQAHLEQKKDEVEQLDRVADAMGAPSAEKS